MKYFIRSLSNAVEAVSSFETPVYANARTHTRVCGVTTFKRCKETDTQTEEVHTKRGQGQRVMQVTACYELTCELKLKLRGAHLLQTKRCRETDTH
jgi:hypothetical protein